MITVLGHKGFIGAQIVRQLKRRALEFYLPERDENLTGKNLGKIIYCIGLTADAKKRPFDTIEAHINKLSKIIQECDFEDITYASSTRIYIHSENKVSESSLLPIDVSDPFELFNLTKLTAESLLLNTVKNFKIVRYSNVYGTDIESENFLTSIISDAIQKGAVTLYTTANSAKDYIPLADAASLTVDISLKGAERIYNVASGINITNGEITNKISDVLKCRVIYSEEAKEIMFPVIDNGLVKNEFRYNPSSNLLDDIDILISNFREKLNIQ